MYETFIIASSFNPAGISNGDTTMGAVGILLMIAFLLKARG